MPDSYPYTISNNKIPSFFEKIRAAARPDRLSQQVLKHWGYTASNDRAFIPILRGLGFIDENGAPSELYNRLKGDTNWKNLLGEQVKELYSDLFATNTNIHTAPDDEVKGAISRITGKDSTSVGRYFSTFKALATLAKFDGKPKSEDKTTESTKETQVQSTGVSDNTLPAGQSDRSSNASFHYNIQIHLPATTDISVYNAIFKSVKEHLNL
jgi:hypothetical protein